jgi:homogentisate phytyltransferase/homogentisate geranylgeranyltransferase
MAKLSAFIQFSRPHTVVATSLQVATLFILSGGVGQDIPLAFLLFTLTLISSLSANIFVVGLNQLTDVGIDRVNKPYLPLASGEYSLNDGRFIVILVGLLAVGLAAVQSLILLITIGLVMLIGSIYSLEPVHLKRRPFWAAASIAFTRGIVANVGIFLHFHQALRPGYPIPWPLVGVLALFFFGYGLVIALFKDIPDLAGDKRYGVRTFTVSLGPARVFNGGRWLFTAIYLVPIAAAIARLPQTDAFLLLIAHLFIVALFWSVSFKVDPADSAGFTRFYLFLWALFYLEYILLSFQGIVSNQPLVA